MEKKEIIKLRNLLKEFLEERGNLLIRTDGTPSMLVTEMRNPRDPEYGENRKLARGIPITEDGGPVEEFLDRKNDKKGGIESVVFDQNDGVIVTQRMNRGKDDDEESIKWMLPDHQSKRIKELENEKEIKNQTMGELQDKLDEKTEQVERYQNQLDTVREKLRSYKSEVVTLSNKLREARKRSEILKDNADKYEAKKRKEMGKRETEIAKSEEKGRDEAKDKLDHYREAEEAINNVLDQRVEMEGRTRNGGMEGVTEKINSLLTEIEKNRESIEEIKSGE